MIKGKFKSAYIGIWILLTGVLILFVTLSFAEDISIGGHTLKKGSFRDVILAEKQTSLMQQDLEEDLCDSLQVENVPEIFIDSVPRNILLFGDSMTLNLALRMAKYAKENGHTFHAVNWDSSNTKLWATTDTLKYFINKFKPDYYFVSLGSNEVFFKDPTSRLPYVKKIIEIIGDSTFIWIGPPNWNEDTGINDMLEKVCGAGRFFRSEGIKMKRKSDNIHPTRQASELWVDSIMRWLKNSRHPILNEVPADSMPEIRSGIVILKALNQ